MTRLEKIIQKKERLVVGLMSGTSIDAVDAVLVKIQGSGAKAKFRQLAFYSHRYPKGFKSFVLQNSRPGSGTVDNISTLNVLCAHFFSDAVRLIAQDAGVSLSRIDLIGSHGQTIHHLPNERQLFGKHIRSTLQIGDPSTIAKLTGIVTVGNFRTGDMALGGQGAPLVPYFDYLAFHSDTKNRALLNIGGIANITLLQKSGTIDDMIAFDTGPGNMLIDAFMEHYFGTPFDRDGRIASSGKIIPSLLAKLSAHRYFSRPLPKSTGREEFGDQMMKHILRGSRSVRKEDVIATVTEFTAATIFDQFNRWALPHLQGEPLHELIVTGGGTKNGAVMNAVRKMFSDVRLTNGDDLGVPSDSKEALCFAVLANETVLGNPTSVPSVTGASGRTVLGTVCL